jgi:hypothetical protein
VDGDEAEPDETIEYHAGGGHDAGEVVHPLVGAEDLEELAHYYYGRS